VYHHHPVLCGPPTTLLLSLLNVLILIRTSAPDDNRPNATQALPLRYPSPPIIMYCLLWWTCPVGIGRRLNTFLSAHKLPATSDEFPVIVNVTLLFPASNESISHLHFILCSVTYFFLLLLSTHCIIIHSAPCSFLPLPILPSTTQPIHFLNTHSFSALDDFLAPSVLLASHRPSVNVRPLLRGVPPSAPLSSFLIPHPSTLFYTHSSTRCLMHTLHAHSLPKPYIHTLNHLFLSSLHVLGCFFFLTR